MEQEIRANAADMRRDVAIRLAIAVRIREMSGARYITQPTP